MNVWEGDFPHENLLKDGFYGLAPANFFPPNDYGLYNMLGQIDEGDDDHYGDDDHDHYGDDSDDDVDDDYDPEDDDDHEDDNDHDGSDDIVNITTYLYVFIIQEMHGNG